MPSPEASITFTSDKRRRFDADPFAQAALVAALHKFAAIRYGCFVFCSTSRLAFSSTSRRKARAASTPRLEAR